VRVEDFLGRPGWSYKMGGGYGLQLFLKRLTDVLGALILLLISLAPGLIFTLGRRLRGLRAYRRLNFLGRGGRVGYLPLALDPGARAGRSDLLNPGQYLAVLLGRLSLVGPRPRPVGSGQAAPAMRPGLSGPWRTEGGEGESSLSRDRLYMHNWSLGEDLRLWATSLPAQLRGRYPDSFLRSIQS